MSAAAGLSRVAGRLRARGFELVELAGWVDRGRGVLRPIGHTQHHTAGLTVAECISRGIDPDTPSLRVVTFGRADLRNALCNWYVSRIGVIYLVAGRTAWHAGPGILGTNSTLIGTEAQHSGGPHEPWTNGSLTAQLAIAVECAREFGYPVNPGVHDHREHAPGRKPDRVNVDPHDFRDRVRVGLLPPLKIRRQHMVRIFHDLRDDKFWVCFDGSGTRRWLRSDGAIRRWEALGAVPATTDDGSNVDLYRVEDVDTL